ncbi:MAG: hypothetical protein IKG46_06850 [Solobacterium sp.]|nr:hypothetical protein [Solobacterium sp.]
MKTDRQIYSEKAREFRSLCRSYTAQKKWLYTLQKRRTAHVNEGMGKDPEQDQMLRRMETQIRLLQDALVRTEEILEEIEARFGEEAADMIWEIYIGKGSLQEAAEQQGISVRTLQRRIRAWLEEIL